MTPPSDPVINALYAVSDVHASARENAAWIDALAARPDAGLIVAGDVDEDIRLVEETLRRCRRKFGAVFYCPGNHELWLERGDRFRDSMEKLEAVLAAAERAGSSTTARVVRGAGGRSVRVVPMLSWHHRSFDTEPPITCWGGLPSAREALCDFGNCSWPAPLDDDTEDVARAVDALNDARGAGAPPEAAADDVVSFSHFLPRIELLPEKRFMYLPCLAEAVGSRFLGARVAALNPDLHVFGHTHFGWDATLDGVRYLQAALAYPAEWRSRPASLAVGAFKRSPLKVWDAGEGIVGKLGAKWSSFYERYPRAPDVDTHVFPPYNAARFSPLPGSEVRDLPPFANNTWTYSWSRVAFATVAGSTSGSGSGSGRFDGLTRILSTYAVVYSAHEIQMTPSSTLAVFCFLALR